MARWKNFQIWRGRLPHWRAEDVTYYATFRHRRELQDDECHELFKKLLATHGRKFDIVCLVVVPELTELLFTVETGYKGEPYELSDVIEKAKSAAGKAIIKKSGERWPPFYAESFDRIVRDDGELEELWGQIVERPVKAGLADDPEDWPCLFVPHSSEN